MPILTIADGDVPSASQINANWRDQVISTVTSATRPSGTEGQFIVETDTDLVYVYSGAAWVPFAGFGAWTATATPTFTQSGAVAKTVTYSRAIKIGRLVIYGCRLDVTGSGTANNAVVVSAPYTAATSGVYGCGTGAVYDSSAGNGYPFEVTLASTTTFQFEDTTAATGITIFEGLTGAAFAAGLASGDVVTFHAMYEAAA